MTPLQRTRRLYAWEVYDLQHRRGVCRIGIGFAKLMTRSAWLHFKLPAALLPDVVMKPTREQPYCIGWSHIALTYADHTDLVLLHELAHAMRFGTGDNPHTPGFVQRYIDLMVWFYLWDKEELQCQAHRLELLR